MTDPKWVTRQQVEFIHEAVIEMAGGAQGLRDAALLESALARPQNQYAYGETDTFQLAASYAEAISRNPCLCGREQAHGVLCGRRFP
jgi:death-on-curing protein